MIGLSLTTPYRDRFRGIPTDANHDLDSANAKLAAQRARRLEALNAKKLAGTLTAREARELKITILK